MARDFEVNVYAGDFAGEKIATARSLWALDLLVSACLDKTGGAGIHGQANGNPISVCFGKADRPDLKRLAERRERRERPRNWQPRVPAPAAAYPR